MPLKIYRVAHWFWAHKIPLVPTLLKIFNRVVFTVVLPPSATIGRGVLLSYNGLGTVIHRNAAIGSNAVVLSDIPDYAIAVGGPARVVRIMDASELPDYFSFKGR